MAFSANNYIHLAILAAVFKAFRAEFVSHINYVPIREKEHWKKQGVLVFNMLLKLGCVLLLMPLFVQTFVQNL
jgi:uracil DNA glycosylase